MSAPPPPPRRTVATHSAPAPPTDSSWSGKLKATGKVWGKKAIDKSVVWNDKIGGKVNDVAQKKFGTEHFWPVSNDFIEQIEKAERILRAFTVEGVMTEDKSASSPSPGAVDAKGKKKTSKKRKVLRKIPPSVIQQAKGLAIFTSMRTGIAPFGGAGGAGIVIAKLPDGSWSGPASISPNNLTAGFLLGVDVYDCILVIRTQQALDSFSTHKATLGAEIGVALGPYGSGAAVEAGKEAAPVFSYVRSRGMYAGVEVVGQVFVERFEENAAMYHWPGVKAGDILAGKVKPPQAADKLIQALQDAESGRAQRLKGDTLDVVVPEGADTIELGDGEVLKLPPTPDRTDGHEQESDPETERIHRASQPGSHNVSHNPSLDNLALPAPSARPPLPVRSSGRPPLGQQHSSVSHYSEDEVYTAPEGPPPGWSAQELETVVGNTKANDEGAVQREEADSEALPSYGTAEAGEPMSEAERREWDQFLAEHQAEEAAREVAGVSGQLESTHIAPASAHAGDSLR